MTSKKWQTKDIITYVLLTLVFVSSWTDINGIFAELPQIVLTQPEGWKLGAYLGLITNLGNVAPMILVIVTCLIKKKFNPVPVNYVIILIGMLACFLLIFFWSKTTFLAGQQRSTALFVLSFFLAILDCTSSITFSDYIYRFRKEFTNAMFLGECFTSLLPSLLTIAQGNGQLTCVSTDNQTVPIYQTARFSVSIYFMCLFLLLSISFISFVILQWTSIAHNAVHVTTDQSSQYETTSQIDHRKTMSKDASILMSIACTYTSGAIFGVMISIAAYVLMPYGHSTFYLGTIISPWMLVLVWMIGLKKPIIPKRFLIVLILLGSVGFGYEMYVAFKSPCPPLADSRSGRAIILLVWLSTYILLGYPRLVIGNYARRHSANGLFWYGFQVQLGALIGSVLAYLLVETFGLFHERFPCEPSTC